MKVLLRVAHVAKAFGGNQVLNDVSFEIHPGEIVGLLGPNGSGKSTLLNAISGFTRADAGSVCLGNTDVTRWKSHEIVHSGIARTFQLPSMPQKMSVLEVTVAASTSHHGVIATMLRPASVKQAERAAIDQANRLLDELLLAKVKDLPAASLSGGQKKLLSIACSLMGAPKLLMLDEPTAGVHPNLRRDIVGTLQRLNQRGISQMIVEHDMHFVREVCTRCIVLDRGRIVADCLPSELATNPKVLEAYLGRPTDQAQPVSQICKEAA
ncbi:ABC transporter ATP-binding protein [Thermomonas sp.]|uniref:ABC transporter ATP-binding protein n=1 Tax=Thermomonas sp. TaxID=1971895 RepID=UPI002488ECA5|nr:ABC transporter ATP-binding protein [Thermomonas sp.]MDI1251595.1 ABC transporter ATP-binding protein [Thermomonas sp.]